MPIDDAIEPFAHFKARLEKGDLGPNLLALKSDKPDQARDFLLKFYSGVEPTHSARDEGGAIFDFVPREAQPSLQASGAPLATPPDLPSFTDFEGREAPTVRDATANPDVVPIRRIQPEEILRLDGVRNFMRKHPVKRPSSLLLSATPVEHRYAHAYQDIENLGGRSVISVWDPKVQGNGFSLAQHWYVAQGAKGVQTIEVGWQVFPQKYGHAKPVLFTYWTADNYVNTGAYNNDNNNFVAYSHSSTVGMALPFVSVPGGAQAELALMFVLHQGNWWLFVNGADQSHAIGYYPTTLFGGGPLASKATEIDYGGETVPDGTYPPMGSGQFANKGAGQAAYQRNIEFMAANGTFSAAALQPNQKYPDEYTISMGTTPTAGEFFYFGGPGGPP